jgi:GT2 family glycosyltransferase
MENKIKTKIAIGVPTYNDFRRVYNLLTSIFTFTPQDEINDCKIVVVDDGTPDEEVKSGLREVCRNFNVPLVEHDKNYGIPKAWNTLTNYFDAEIVVLLNDDIQVCEASWLKCMIYFLENNDKIGGVGWPLYHMAPDGELNPKLPKPNFDSQVALVGAPIGCSFAFKKNSYDLVSGGFPEQLFSFYEEILFGFELAKVGYGSYMLPYPAMEHWGSQTFSKNPELSIAKPNPEVLSMEKYKEIMLKRFPLSRIEPVPGFVYRMDYSRAVFALHFGVEDYWDAPQVEVHHRLVYALPARKIKWLDKNMIEREEEIR